MNQNRSRSVLSQLMLPILFFLAADLRAAGPGDKGPGLAELYRAGRAKLVADLVIDVGALPEEAQIQAIADFDTDREGNLYALDCTAGDIKKFDRTGKFIKVIGRKGQGPGEFQVPFLMAVNNGTILVYDATGRKLNRFDLDGKFIRSLTWPVPGETTSKIMSLPGGGFILETEKDHFDLSDKPQDIRIVTIGEDLEPGKELCKRSVLRTKRRRTPQGLATNIPQPYVPDIRWTVTPEGLALIGFSDKYAFDTFEPLKGRTGGFSWHAEPVPVTAEDRKRWFNSMLITDVNTEQGRPIGDNVPDYLRKNTFFPEFKPLFDQIICDPEGNILVCPVTVEGRSIVFDAFSPAGRFIARTDLSGGRKDLELYIKRTANGSLWSLSVDTEGDLLLSRWRISE